VKDKISDFEKISKMNSPLEPTSHQAVTKTHC